MVPILLLLGCCGLAAEPVGTVRLGTETAENVQVRLVSAGTDRTVVGYLHATFITIGDVKPREFQVRFPSHSHSTHEATLMNVIRSSLGTDIATENRVVTLRKANRFEAIFSIPKEPKGNDLSKWYLVSIQSPQPRSQSASPSSSK